MKKQARREVSALVANGQAPGIGVRLFGVSGRELVGYLMAAILLAILMSTAGAFDSDDIRPLHRIGLWLTISLLTVIQTLVLFGLLSPRLPASPVGRILASALTVLGVVALMTAELHLLKFTPLLPYEPDPLPAFFLFLAPPIGAIAAMFVLSRIVVPEGLTPRRLPLASPSDPPRIGFQSAIAGYLPAPTRLADWPSEPVIRVRAADHYLEVHTQTGRRFLRGRMSDALRELAHADGIQPHRSWWVASSSIASSRRNGRDHVLITTDEAEIPVARARVPEMRRMGLI